MPISYEYYDGNYATIGANGLEGLTSGQEAAIAGTSSAFVAYMLNFGEDVPASFVFKVLKSTPIVGDVVR